MKTTNNYQIQFYIITYLNEQSETLFYFNTDQLQQKNTFKAVRYLLPIPQDQTAIYYYFHQPTDKQNKHHIKLQRRNQWTSNIQDSKQKWYNFKLLGGVKLWTKFKKSLSQKSQGQQSEGQKSKGLYYVYMKLISANDIQVTPNNDKIIEPKQNSLPFLIIRSFSKGYPLKINQQIKIGKTEFKIADIYVNANHCKYQEDEIINLDQKINESKKRYENGESYIEKLCQVCKQQNIQEGNPVINLCNCKNMHVNCLSNSIDIKLKIYIFYEKGKQQYPTYYCQSCKIKFPKLIIKNGIKHLLFSPLTFITLLNLTSQQKQKIEISKTHGEDNYVTIGSITGNRVKLKDQSVSRKHAKIILDERGFKIKDCESTFGTGLHEKGVEIRLHYSERAFQINSTCVSCKIQSKLNKN